MKSYLLRSVVISIILVFVLNALGMYSFWYSSISWYDMLVHFLGGVFIGFLLLYLFPQLRTLPTKRTIHLIILGVVIIGVGWELFEYAVWMLTHDTPNAFSDAISDVICDTFGGALAVSLFLMRRRKFPTV